ncbi:DUF4340 domain-containing protein [Oscillatoria sp. CS-180]|uniref:DUF4340 domain-containing protein n=1 Tax=Oscillatoria sp. CS-180 TaxID=3021720 RepID=UPI00232C6B8C|nr:DUF4340 domain-containing protein [Oscillatoria sp. CS-180]MDB9526571.1 DUF4340 domain-containing protein [Oscillatoria sp. CS-180]
MKLQRSTVSLVAVALLLGGVVLLTQARQSNPNHSTTAQGESEASPVFTFDEADVAELHVETKGQAVSFERDEEGLWQMTEPEEHPAEEAAIAFLLSRLTTDGLVQAITLDADNQAEFGLEVPFATVDLTLTDGNTHSLILGDADFSGQNYYALIDPEAFPLPEALGEVDAAIVSENIINGVDRPLEEWKAIVETLAPGEEDTLTNDETSDTDDDDPEAFQTAEDSEPSEAEDLDELAAEDDSTNSDEAIDNSESDEDSTDDAELSEDADVNTAPE